MTAAVVFHGALLVAGVVLLQLNSYAWFFSDDWSWLGERDVRSFDDLMRSYNDHWSTVPFVLWRVMYRVFGVGSYTPYLVTLIASHLAIVAMLRVLMRRCGVGPWTASVVAAPLVLLGIGEQAMSLASVLNFNLAIVLVLVHLVIVMDGPAGPGKRDLFGLGVGLVALMTSGIAVLGVAAIGLTTLLRRGPRAAAFHVAPLGTIYLLWYAVFHTEALIVPGVGNATPSQLASWTWEGTSTAAKGLVTTPWGWGAVLAVILWVLVAVAVALSIRGGGVAAALRGDLAAPLALAAAGIGFQVATGWGRAALAPDTAAGSRYLYLLVAWMLPLVAVAAQELAERRRMAGLAVCAILLAGIPWNSRQFGESIFNEGFFTNYKTIMTAIAHDPRLDDVPRDIHPYRFLLDGPTAGWLRANRSDGGLPEPPTLSPAQEAEVTARLMVGQRVGWAGDDCTSTGSSATTTLSRGEEVGVKVPRGDGSIWPGPFISVEVLDGDAVVGRAAYQTTAVELYTGIGARPATVRFSTLDGSEISLCE